MFRKINELENKNSEYSKKNVIIFLLRIKTPTYIYLE